MELHSTALCGPLTRFIQNFLSSRTFRVKVGNSLSDSFPQVEGIVLSCTLFALAINGLATHMPASVMSSLYVDDFAIFSSPAERRIQLAVNTAYSWIQRHEYKFSSGKTVSMHFN